MYNIETLKDLISKGRKFEYLFFWGNIQKGEDIDTSCLSQMFEGYPFEPYPPFTLNDEEWNKEFATAEHHMMFHKTKVFGDNASAELILKGTTEVIVEKLPFTNMMQMDDTKTTYKTTYISPKEAKTLGRSLKNFCPEIWDKYKLGVVYRGNLAKFTQHPKLKEYLLSTGNKILVEASPYDKVWGIGLGKNDPRVYDPNLWLGQNLLGFILMDVRETIRKYF